ncbi:MAG TPA: hypothetical protein VKV04_23660 [Verrucomicrobiae bacterium]|nr:hypothetical protein [Verrucomicrobiae bacterium]
MKPVRCCCPLFTHYNWLITAGLMALATFCRAQENSWTSPSSGNWEDASSWSLGILPGTNQSILLTNYGWKAVQISPATAQNYPQSLNVNSIDISSPTNSFNTLLLNYAGQNTPLTAQAVTVEGNSTMAMYWSALQLDGGNGVGLQVGGEFDQNDSVVAGRQINVGYIGPGIYNMNSGFLEVANLWIGGAYGGLFIQNGGTNAFGITDVQSGNYVLSNGYYAATIYFDGGQFTQEGGLLQSDLTIYDGTYLLAGGVHQGSVTVPSSDGYGSGSGGMTQSGGTNLGSLDIGSYGWGSYTLSDGMLFAGGITVDDEGTLNQSGGTIMVTGVVSTAENQIGPEEYSGGSINLNGGLISSTGIYLNGHYSQNGGTNLVAGDIDIAENEDVSLSMFGGLLTANNLSVSASWIGGVFLNEGTMIITNQLSIAGPNAFPFWSGFKGGGQLLVSNIWLSPQASFSCGSGTITQSGTLTVASADINAGSGPTQFGRLELSSDGNTNSTLSMPAGASIIRFADSSGQTWSNGPSLMIENWSGSPYGSGAQQIIFGKSAGALTAQQLAQIQFQNPTGLASGIYPARILSSGEIVPDPVVAPQPQLALQPQANGMRLTLQGVSGSNYAIEVSTDLVHWLAWTNQACSNSTFSVTDCEATNYPMRFYRAALAP